MQKFKTVDDFLISLSEDQKAQVELLRGMLRSQPGVSEHIKWNAPSYVLNDEDRITFNVLNKQDLVKLILHMGAVRKEDKNASPILQDATGLIEWNSNIRGTLSFKDLDDIRSKKDKITIIVRGWLAIS